ncbi:MAG: AAA family ATPase [Polaromonas sp.]|nr:AAA family ATPase [Polaromonas sp.]
MTGQAPMSQPDDGRPAEILHDSQSTRVYRVAHAGAATVFKEPLGPDAARRLSHEESILTRLAGLQGIVQLADGPRAAGVLALKDCAGTALAHLLMAGPMDMSQLLALAPQLARSVAALHQAGVIHRDINPANMVLAADGELVLIDFDLAMLADQHLAVAQNGQMVGTLDYLAPEQTGRTGHAVDQRSDLYALGATLYEMATGDPPFKESDPLQLIHHHLVREAVAPLKVNPHVPQGLSDIIMRLLAKAPEKRYQSAEGLLYDLTRLSEPAAGTAACPFLLGERDFPARLAAPEQLVGRESEREILHAAFVQALTAMPRTVLVEGAPGVGKSALIDQLRPAVAAAGGWFVSGKVDLYHRNEAKTGALTQALRALGRLLLVEAGDELAAHRRRILDSLGRNAGLMTRLLPEFELLLGEQPPAPEVEPRQAELQMQQALTDLIRAVASPTRPLVIVLDDLQWAAALALRAIERLMVEPGLQGLQLVCAYRTDDLGEVLPPMLAQWRQQPCPPGEITLDNLTPASMGELAGQMLRLAPGPASELARAVGELTAGNPFDTVEMINALRKEGVLSMGSAGWQWRAADIRRFVGSSNVVDLLSARIARLPPDSRELLAFMSCLGNEVDHKPLAAATGLTEDALREQLRAPLDDGLLIRDQHGAQDSLRFRHDRVQQAVLGAMDDSQRTQRQLAMARRLASQAPFEDDAAQQYMACLNLLDNTAERQRAAQLFYGLAQKLASAASYLLAERYLAAAATLMMAGDATVAHGSVPALRRNIDAARHAAMYSLGRLDESDPLYSAMQQDMPDALDLVEPTCLQMRSLDMRGRTEDAKALGLHMLMQLGLHVPPDYKDPKTEQRLDALTAWIKQDSAVDHPARPQIQDRRLLAIAKVLGRTVRSALVRYDTKAIVWLLLETQRLWAAHGPCAEMVASLGRMGSMLISLRKDFRTAYDIARHVLTVGEALGYEPQTSEARFVFCTYTGHWFEPLENIHGQLARAYDGVVAGGDMSYAGYVHIVLVTDLLEIAPTIQVSAAQVEAGIALCTRTGNMLMVAQHMCERQMLRALRGQTLTPGSFDDAQFNEKTFLERLGNLPYVPHTYAECRALFALIMGDSDLLISNAAFGKALLASLPGYYMTVYAHFFTAMSCARQIQLSQHKRPTPGAVELQADTPAEIQAELDASRSWLDSRAADQPYNFLHLSRLLEAEQAWALGDLWKAAAAFDAAVREAESRERVWHRALITERAGLFQLHLKLEHGGRQLLVKARNDYQAWGATAKVARMHEEHPFLLASPVPNQEAHAAIAPGTSLRPSVGRGSSNVSTDALDLMGVLRASQALSSETSLEQLTARVTDVLASLSGATDVKVLSWHDSQWWLLAPAPGESSVTAAWAAECGLLPLSAIRYVERTNEPLLVDDATRDDRFARDPYFKAQPFCSLLVAPISSQGSVRAMLLLENRLSSAAFNAQRLDAVMLIAGQLAVSLANAQLYQNLEQRVHARTRELEQTQAELVATARRAGKAEIANNVLHNVGNVLNSVNVSASVVRRTLNESRAQGLARAVALLNEHENDLPGFIGRDPRGKALLGYLNELVGALHEERQVAMGDLDRLARSVEHITYVVATQQSHSGPSSVLEAVQPEELLEEALHLSADVIQRCRATVMRQYEPVPATALDRQRLLQILVNLIGNAAQAMEGMPELDRRLTLATRLVQDDSGTRFLMTVQDEGEGIAPANLTRIFAHGFTTRQDGHGFGLHSAALGAMEMGIKLSAHSDGPGRGAIFTLAVPVPVQERPA